MFHYHMKLPLIFEYCYRFAIQMAVWCTFDKYRLSLFKVAERLERQEDEVRRLVREALASLPDNLDLDSKLLVPSLEELQLRPKSDAANAAEDRCSSLDRLMCNIVDALWGDRHFKQVQVILQMKNLCVVQFSVKFCYLCVIDLHNLQYTGKCRRRILRHFYSVFKFKKSDSWKKCFFRLQNVGVTNSFLEILDV